MLDMEIDRACVCECVCECMCVCECVCQMQFITPLYAKKRHVISFSLFLSLQPEKKQIYPFFFSRTQSGSFVIGTILKNLLLFKKCP